MRRCLYLYWALLYDLSWCVFNIFIITMYKCTPCERHREGGRRREGEGREGGGREAEGGEGGRQREGGEGGREGE